MAECNTQPRDFVHAGVREAAERLLAGELVAFPTETVWGLGADATREAAIAALYAAKGRPAHNPLIIHVESTAAAHAHGVFSPAAEALAAAFWPGPLTLVLPRRETSPVVAAACAGLPTIALRVPAHAGACALIAATGRPIAAPSANRSGHVSATAAAHVRADFGLALTLAEGGDAPRHGIESTIVGCDGNGQALLLRAGAIPREAIEAVLGRSLGRPAAGIIAAPGALASHYAPGAPVRLNITAPQPGEPWLTFGPAPPHTPSFPLSPAGDLAQAAAALFAALRAADALAPASIAVMPIPAHGLGEAIADRLARAAAPRPVASP